METPNQEINQSNKAKTFKLVSVVLGSTLLAIIIFASGVAVGMHKAKFSYHFGENYERNFMGPRPDGPMGGPMGFFPDMGGRGMRNGHGVAGTILSISDNNLVVKDRDNKENSVSINDKTAIKSHQDDLKATDLKANDFIVVLGKPDESGVIKADLIRVFKDNPFNQPAQ